MEQAPTRRQQTLSRPVSVTGTGLFSGCDVRVELCPAEADFGIVFSRTDLPGHPRVPASIEFVAPQARCTVLNHQDVSVSLVEHLLAALAGLHVDNCLVRLNAPELPIGDGSSSLFVDAILAAGICAQPAPREVIAVNHTLVFTESDSVGIAAQSPRHGEYEIGFLLDYGPGPISRQTLNIAITPERFLAELAACRTFARVSEVNALREQQLCLRATPQNALVFDQHGVIDNRLRFQDECVRHKILDCIGDFALIGADLAGRFIATRSGHRLNHEIIRRLLRARQETPQQAVPAPHCQMLAAQSRTGPPLPSSVPSNTSMPIARGARTS